MLTLLPGGRFPLFLYVVLGHEIERVRAGLHFLPLEGAGLVDPEGNFVHQNEEVGADLVDAAGVGTAGGAGLVHTAGLIVDGAMGGAGPGHAASMVVEGAAADADLVDAAGMYDPQVGVAGGTGTVDAAMQHHIDRVSEIIESEDEGVVLDDLPQQEEDEGVVLDDLPQQEEDEGVVLDDLPQQEVVAVGPMNLDLLSVNQSPQ